jgi:hypothetical protein
MIGSVIPGIGTAVGGLVGGLIGGVKGFFGGAKRKREQHLLDLQKQREEDDMMLTNLQDTYGGGRVNLGRGAASADAQRLFGQKSAEDQYNILKSFGNRDALQEWYENARAAEQPPVA